MKKIAIIAVGIIAVVALIGSSLAYFTSRDEAVNKFAIQDPEIVVTEEFPPDQNPNEEVVKAPKIMNTGEYPCYVRVRVDFSSGLIEQQCEIDYNANFDIREDGFWYWKEPLQPGESTEELFTYVKSNQTENFEITVYSEAVNIGSCSDYVEAWGL